MRTLSKKDQELVDLAIHYIADHNAPEVRRVQARAYLAKKGIALSEEQVRQLAAMRDTRPATADAPRLALGSGDREAARRYLEERERAR